MNITMIILAAGILIFAGVVARWAVGDSDDEACGFSERADKDEK